MSILDRSPAAGGIVPPRTSPIRPGAEEYAFSLGLTPGGPGWGDAIRDYVLNGGNSRDEIGPMRPAVSSSGVVRPAYGYADDESEHAAHLDPANADLDDETYGSALEQAKGHRSEALAVRGQRARRVQAAPVPSAARRRPRNTEPRGMTSPIPGFGETDPKPRLSFWDRIWPDPSLALPPKAPARRRRPGEKEEEEELKKRFFMNDPLPGDAAPTARRLVEALRRLPIDRRQISRESTVPQTSTPSLDRYFSTMIALETGMTPDGRIRISPDGTVGAAQVMPKYGAGMAKLAGLPWSEHRLRTDQTYNEMVGFANYKYLVSKFGGDFVKAAAAYNAGERATRTAIRRAEKAGEPRNWERYLPGETREYVESFRKFNRMQDD